MSASRLRSTLDAMPSVSILEAAGGALWRPTVGGAGFEIALVHRPSNGRWSLPKGNLLGDENLVVGARRAVSEETGHDAVPGRPLGEIRQLQNAQPTRVRYRALRVTGGGFRPTHDVDQLIWLTPAEGRRFLAPDRKQRILAELAHDPEPTWPLVIVRHGSAGQPAPGHGPDPERPLDGLGQAQSWALVPLLAALRVQRVVSADLVRCLDTVRPYAAEQRIAVETESLVLEMDFPSHVSQSLDRIADLMQRRESTVVCSQGGVIPHLIEGLCREFGQPAPADTTTRKGGAWVLHMTAAKELRLAGIEQFAPPPVLATQTA